MPIEQYLWLIPIGLIAGACGTLIGVGGGFLLVPVLLLVYPEESPEILTSISLAVVFFNALSGSIAYARMRRIDYRSGLLFSSATVPGAVLGALTSALLPRRTFDLLFAGLLFAVSFFLLLKSNPHRIVRKRISKRHVTRNLIDSEGNAHVYSFNPAIGVVLSLFVGYISSLLGIGGGIIHVPALVYLLNFPIHVATATSQFILALTSAAGTATHVASNSFEHGFWRTVYLSVGVLLGAQLGARLSRRIRGLWIIRGLALALLLLSLRILLRAV